jgi:Kef-type K+ transport system membrane component KefB
MDVLFLIMILLVATRVFAELAERVNLPALVGELTAGVALGLLLKVFQSSMPGLWSATQSETYDSIVHLGMFFLMLLAGIRMEPLDFARTSRSAVLVALGGMIVPVAAGIALGLIVLPDSSLKLVQSLFLGTAIAITAVPVAVRIFMDLGELETRIGKTVIAAALWDDLVSLFLLAILIAAMGGGGDGGFGVQTALLLFGKVLFFFAVTIPVGLFVFPLVGRYFKYLHFPEVDFSMLLIGALAYATFAEAMELHFIIGAFLAGMFFHPQSVDPPIYRRVEDQMSGITRGFLAPIFFVSVGLQLDFSAITATPIFLTVLILIALASKFIGAGLPAYAIGLSRYESMIVGVGMSGRGAVELIVAGVALEAGLFLQPSPPPPVVQSLYSAIVIMALVTTLVTPIILQRMAKSKPPPP